MTATINDEATGTKGGSVGRIARVIGPVVDVEFPSDAMPDIYNALTVEVTLGDQTQTIVLEVANIVSYGLVFFFKFTLLDRLVFRHHGS